MSTYETMRRNWELMESFVGPDRKITREIMDRYLAERKHRGWDDEDSELSS